MEPTIGLEPMTCRLRMHCEELTVLFLKHLTVLMVLRRRMKFSQNHDN